ncbi:MAG: hypothetical protein M1831_007269 [Alyxoria varia]|nr:MAG: hypothetical protein M1831_007269 [Alyxoria varia]
MAILNGAPGLRLQVWVAGLPLRDYGTFADDLNHQIWPLHRVRRIVPVREEHYVPVVIIEPRFQIPPAYITNDDKIKVSIHVDNAPKPDATCAVKASEVQASHARGVPFLTSPSDETSMRHEPTGDHVDGETTADDEAEADDERDEEHDDERDDESDEEHQEGDDEQPTEEGLGQVLIKLHWLMKYPVNQQAGRNILPPTRPTPIISAGGLQNGDRERERSQSPRPTMRVSNRVRDRYGDQYGTGYTPEVNNLQNSVNVNNPDDAPLLHINPRDLTDAGRAKALDASLRLNRDLIRLIETTWNQSQKQRHAQTLDALRRTRIAPTFASNAHAASSEAEADDGDGGIPDSEDSGDPEDSVETPPEDSGRNSEAEEENMHDDLDAAIIEQHSPLASISPELNDLHASQQPLFVPPGNGEQHEEHDTPIEPGEETQNVPGREWQGNDSMVPENEEEEQG